MYIFHDIDLRTLCVETGKHLIYIALIFSRLYSILKYEQKPELYFWTCRISFFCLNLHIFIVKAYEYFITRHAIPTPECNAFMPWSFIYSPFDLRNSMCANKSKCTYWPGKNIPWILNPIPCLLFSIRLITWRNMKQMHSF